MSEEAKQIGCVLRIFGAPQMAVQQAVAGFPAGWNLCRVRCMSRGGETLVALTAEDKAGLTRAEQSLRTCFPGDLYAQGDTDLADLGTAQTAAGLRRCRRRGPGGAPAGSHCGGRKDL